MAHRDLKLDNVLLDGSDPPVLKLTDFGFAKTWTGVGRNTVCVGGWGVGWGGMCVSVSVSECV